MKLSKTLFVVVCASLAVSFSRAQNPISQIPTRASVTASASPPDSLTFQLRLSPAPDNIGGGKITCIFQDTSITQADTIGIGTATVWQTSTEIHDEQSLYNLSLEMSAHMASGNWQLKTIRIEGRLIEPTDLTIEDKLEFQISAPTPIRVHLEDIPTRLVAGQPFSIKAIVDEYPKNVRPPCVVSIGIRMIAERSEPRIPSSALVGADLKPGQTIYELKGQLDPYASGGTWRGNFVIDAAWRNEPRPYHCDLPKLLDPPPPFTVTVQGGPHPVVPISVSVTVHPSQARLLSGEADRINAKVIKISAQLLGMSAGDARNLLLQALKDALTDVDTTEAKFRQQVNPGDSSKAIAAFFDDIRYGYAGPLNLLGKEMKASDDSHPKLLRVSLGLPLPVAVAAKPVLDSMTYNAKAYELVAATDSLFFNLKVTSDPDGTTISYRHQGALNFESASEPTTVTIPNLEIGIYDIRAQKDGCMEKTVPYRAVDDPSRSLHITLKCKRGVK